MYRTIVLRTVLAITGLVVLVVVVLGGMAFLSMVIVKTPSCLTFSSHGDSQLGNVLAPQMGRYLTTHGFDVRSAGSGYADWKSERAWVQWTSDWRLALAVCTDDEASTEWLVTARALQNIAMEAHWSPAVFLNVNPEISKCREGNSIELGFPVRFGAIDNAFARVKATCRAVPAY